MWRGKKLWSESDTAKTQLVEASLTIPAFYLFLVVSSTSKGDEISPTYSCAESLWAYAL